MIKLLTFIIKMLPERIAYSHCDIPCGIYDPHHAQLAAHTVIRMTGLINALQVSQNPSFEERKKIIHQITRYAKVKEEHAEIIKHEVRVVWGDYFKPEHFKDHPNLHELVHKIMKLTSKSKQEIDMSIAQELLASVQEFAEIFWKTKGRETARVASLYPTEGELILPK